VFDLGYGYGLGDNGMVPLNGVQEGNLDNYYKGANDSGVNTKANIK
jgi:hypothetical protein